MIFIKKGITECELIGITPLLKQQLRAALSFENKSHIIAKAVARKKFGYVPKRMQWNGITYLIDDNNRFPSGLLARVLAILDAAGEEYQYLEEPTIPEASPMKLSKELDLWEHQGDAMAAIKKNISGMVRIGTGGGKTKLSVKTSAEVGQYPYLFVVNRISLLTQTHSEYSNYFGESIGWIGNGKIDVQKINIATIGTICSILNIKTELESDENLNYTPEQIASLKKLLKNCRFVVVDECHHAASATYKKMMKALPNAIYRIGLSATPFRTDGQDILLEAAFGNVIYSKSASELIRQGVLCQPEIFFVEYKDAYLSKKYPKNAKGGAYNTIYKECVVENELFNTLVAKLAIINADLNRLTLISVKQVNHGKHILDILKSLDPTLAVEFLHGKNKEVLGEERVKQDFATGKIKVLISTLFDEGVDIPSVVAIIDAGGGKSPIKALQLIGRAIRKFGKKKRAYIFMFIQPYQHLYKHSNARAQILKTEEAFNLQILDWENE